MSDRLLLRLHADDSLSWLSQDVQGRVAGTAAAGAPPAAALARARRVVALVPAEAVLVVDTPRLSAARAQFAKAVPFALEDQLASPVEDLHFALPERLTAARVPVAVVARERLRGWLARLAEDGIRPDALLPDALALPANDGGTIAIEDTRALLRLANGSAFACDLAGLPQWLECAASGEGATLAPEVFDFRAAPPLNLLQGRVARYHPRQREPLALFAASLPAEAPLNLLQGEFAPAHRQLPAQRLWRAAGLSAAAALGLGLVYVGADWWHLSRESQRLDDAMRETLHLSFPEMDNVAGADPRTLMESALKRSGAGGEATGLLRVLGQVAPVLGSSTRYTLKSIEYHNATLELGLRTPDVPTLDLVRERINTLGLKAEVTAANSADNGVDGRLRIAGAKP